MKRLVRFALSPLLFARGLWARALKRRGEVVDAPLRPEPLYADPYAPRLEPPQSAAPAVEAMKLAFGRLSGQLARNIHRRLERHSSDLVDDFTLRFQALADAMAELKRTALGRAELLHRDLEALRSATASRLDAVEAKGDRLRGALERLEARSEQAEARLIGRMDHVEQQVEQQLKATRYAFANLKESTESRIETLADYQRRELEELRSDHQLWVGDYEHSQRLLRDRVHAISDHLRGAAKRADRLTREAEESFGLGKKPKSLFRRMLHPIRWWRCRRDALMNSIRMHRLLCDELATFSADLQELGEDLGAQQALPLFSAARSAVLAADAVPARDPDGLAYGGGQPMDPQSDEAVAAASLR
jgi:hypothetical protein